MNMTNTPARGSSRFIKRNRILSALLGMFASALILAVPAAAAPSNPRVVGTATQVSGSSASVTVTTSGAINAGDVLMIVAASDLNANSFRMVCKFCSSEVGQQGSVDADFAPSGSVGQARARTYVGWAPQDAAAGSTLSVEFAGAGGAKSVTVIAVSGGEKYGVQATNGSAAIQASGAGTAIGWTCATSCSVPGGLMMVSASVISGGGSDSYTEDAAWTFLHQAAAGAWPAIRIAYKATGAGGTFSYGLTDATSRSWISGALIVK